MPNQQHVIECYTKIGARVNLGGRRVWEHDGRDAGSRAAQEQPPREAKLDNNGTAVPMIFPTMSMLLIAWRIGRIKHLLYDLSKYHR